MIKIYLSNLNSAGSWNSPWMPSYKLFLTPKTNTTAIICFHWFLLSATNRSCIWQSFPSITFKMHNDNCVTISDFYAAACIVHWSAKNISKLSNWILPWEIEDSIGPDNSNPRSFELFFVSLQSLSYHCSIVLLLLHHTPGIRLYINNIKLSRGE